MWVNSDLFKTLSFFQPCSLDSCKHTTQLQTQDFKTITEKNISVIVKNAASPPLQQHQLTITFHIQHKGQPMFSQTDLTRRFNTELII